MTLARVISNGKARMREIDPTVVRRTRCIPQSDYGYWLITNSTIIQRIPLVETPHYAHQEYDFLWTQIRMHSNCRG